MILHTRPALTRFVLCAAFAMPTLASADCFQPCGAPVSGRSGAPTASDALFILNVAVGAETTCADCECDTDSSGSSSARRLARVGVSATDALRVLKVAVGIPTPLVCPPCDAVDPTTAIARGRAALERDDLARADEEFTCAVSADPGHSEANLFRGVTRLLEFVARDSEVLAVFSALGGTGSLDVYDFGVDGPNIPTAPTVSDVSSVVFGGFDSELLAALDNLAVPAADSSFVTHVGGGLLPAFAGLSLATVEIDRADVLALTSILHLLRFQLFFTLAGYSDSTVDLPLENFAAVAGDDCGKSFLEANPDFFTLAMPGAFMVAKLEFRAMLDDLIASLDAISAETDSQLDDLLLVDDIPTADAPRVDRDTLALLRESLDGPVTDTVSCDGTMLRLSIAPLFDDPFDRSDLPPFVPTGVFQDTCQLEADPTDPTFHNAFPGVSSFDELQTRLVCAAAGPPPTNDTCTDSVAILSTPFVDNVNTKGATTTADESVSCASPTGHGVWYSYTPSGAETLEIHTLGSDFDTVLAVYTGTCTNLVEVACNDEGAFGFTSEITLPLAGGETYLIQALGYRNDSGSLFVNVRAN